MRPSLVLVVVLVLECLRIPMYSTGANGDNREGQRVPVCSVTSCLILTGLSHGDAVEDGGDLAGF
jgi:hypothetical protein